MSTLVLVLCLAASVAGSALVRMERSAGDYNSGHCGAPTNIIPNGGIKLFPTTDFSNPHDQSCQHTTNPNPWFNPLRCEYKFYCDDGYEVDGYFHLECVHDEFAYKWEGHVPTCVAKGGFTSYAVPLGILLPLSLMITVACAARRRTRLAGPRCSSVVVQTSSTPSRGRLLRTGGPPGYKRFDDSNIQVPRNVGTPSANGAQGATIPSVPPPPYMCPGGPASAPSSKA